MGCNVYNKIHAIFDSNLLASLVSQTYCRRTTGKKRSNVLLVITYGSVTLR